MRGHAREPPEGGHLSLPLRLRLCQQCVSKPTCASTIHSFIHPSIHPSIHPITHAMQKGWEGVVVVVVVIVVVCVCV
jgi:hypothetical protein